MAHGRQLYTYLFGKGRKLRAYLDDHPEYEQGQLTLSLAEDTLSLDRLSWEFLHDGGDFLCGPDRMMLTRHPLEMRSLTPAPGAAPLRVLVVIPSPEDQPAFDAESELRTLQMAVDEAIGSGALELGMVPESSTSALLEAVQGHSYQVVHYIGHGAYPLSQHQGYLCFEDDIGQTELVSGAQLPRFLRGGPPRLVVLARCETTQVGVLDAFASVAHGLLERDIPAVLLTPANASTATAAAFYTALYTSLANGETVLQAFREAQLALQKTGPGEQSPGDLDWGTCILYHRTSHLQLVRASSGEREAGAAEVSLAQSALIGRKKELQAVRKALRAGAHTFYIRGSEGVGKQAFVSYLLAHINPKRNATLVVHCAHAVEPLTILAEIAEFWRSGQTNAGHKAAALLLDASRDPFERAKAAQALVARRRYLYVFVGPVKVIGSEARSESDSKTPADRSHEILRSALLGLLAEPGRSLFFFTGSQRWPDLDTLDTSKRREIYLPLLSFPWAVEAMHQWPALRRTTLDQKEAIYRHLGGHPKALQLLNGWLSLGQDLDALFDGDSLPQPLAADWLAYLSEQILDLLDPGEREVLRLLSLFRQPFSAGTIAELTPVTTAYAAPLIEKWRKLGLIQPVELTGPRESTSSGVVDQKGGGETEQQFSLQATTRHVMLSQLSPAEARQLHVRLAAYFGAPMIDAARRHVVSRNITDWSPERTEWLARDANGVLGVWLRRSQEPSQTQELVERALAWQYHLMEAGETEAAVQIIQAIAPELNAEGQQELSRLLLQRAIQRSGAFAEMRDVDTLARLRLEEGHLAAALGVYEDLYQSLDPERARLQRARVLMRAANVQRHLGDVEVAITNFKSALRIVRSEGDREGEAECLHQLAAAYRAIEDPKQALVFSQAAKEHYEALDYPYGLAAVEQEQGRILTLMGKLESAIQRFAASLSLCRKLGDRQCVAANLTEIGLLFERLGRTEMAIRMIEEALDEYEYLKSPEQGGILTLLEQLRMRKQRLDEAILRFRESKRTGFPSDRQ
ncbi:MAG: CHAT domain-containing tetratricopeptide repeat protein [Anaerolineae bacterium]